jgi:hypothetical protein
MVWQYFGLIMGGWIFWTWPLFLPTGIKKVLLDALGNTRA